MFEDIKLELVGLMRGINDLFFVFALIFFIIASIYGVYQFLQDIQRDNCKAYCEKTLNSSISVVLNNSCYCGFPSNGTIIFYPKA
jgi:hypothetical protein